MENCRSTESALEPAVWDLTVSDAPLVDAHRTAEWIQPPLHELPCGVTKFLLAGLFVFLGTSFAAQAAMHRAEGSRGPILAFAQIRSVVAAAPQAATRPLAAGTKGSPAAQASQRALQLPEFEVASVKPVDMNGQILNMFAIHPGGRLDVKGWELNSLIAAAFLPERISGGADWTRSQKFDIQAVPPKEMQASITDLRTQPFIADPHLRQMLQALLISRFRLRFHYETVTSDAYALQRGGKPPAFRPTSIAPSKTNSWQWRPITLDHGRWVMQGATMTALAHTLSGNLGVRVLDETGLTGAYDYQQRGTYEEAPAPGQSFGPSLLHFVAELQLTLHKVKRPLNVFVIDGAERLLPN